MDVKAHKKRFMQKAEIVQGISRAINPYHLIRSDYCAKKYSAIIYNFIVLKSKFTQTHKFI